jgi:cytochrome c-type biogenesis protein CcmH
MMLLLLSPIGVAAVEPNEILADTRLEARARALSAELRCLVCQNQSIDDSHAPLARDLRLLVRERLQAGDSDEAVLKFIVARYGEFVLLRPRLGLNTLLLWLAPPAMLLLALAFLVVKSRRERARADRINPLTADEEARFAELLRNERRDQSHPSS